MWHRYDCYDYDNDNDDYYHHCYHPPLPLLLPHYWRRAASGSCR